MRRPILSLLHRAASLAAGAIAIAVLATPAAAYRFGIFGYSGRNNGVYCGNGGCHVPGVGTQTPSVRFEGPTQVEPGAEATYRFVLESANPIVQFLAGVNIAASGGELIEVPGQSTHLIDGEITHLLPKEVNASGEAAWEFIWRAPDEPGEYILFGAGNNVDDSFTPEGDASNLTMIAVAVGVAPPVCPGDCNGDNMVAVNELVAAVNIALGNADPETCPSIDVDGNGQVGVNELVAAVSRALNGC